MENQIVATVDLNEPFEVFEEVDDHPEVDDIEIERMDAADIEILGVGFERKRVEDYAASLQDGRIEEQTQKLGQKYKVAYILIDGDMADTESPFSAMKPESLRGSMCSLTARENSGVHSVIPCSETSVLVDVAVRLARKHVEESNRDFLSTGSVDIGQPSVMRMYGCVPGIGSKTAESLYQTYPDMKQFMQFASVESLCEIDGIGEKTAETIIETIHNGD